MLAGTSVQLAATVTNDPPAVTWSVNGVPGGSASSGTISTSGLYTAPQEPPAPATVTIRAASTRAFDEATIQIEAQSTQPPAPTPNPPPPPSPAPAPSPPPAPAPAPPPAATAAAPTPPPAPAAAQAEQAEQSDPKSVKAKKTKKARKQKKVNLLRKPLLAARKRSLLISTRSARAGRVEIKALRGSSTLGRCVVRTPAKRELTCRVMLQPGTPVKGIRVILKLRSHGKVVAFRRATYVKATRYYLGSALQCWIGPGAAKPKALR